MQLTSVLSVPANTVGKAVAEAPLNVGSFDAFFAEADVQPAHQAASQDELADASDTTSEVELDLADTSGDQVAADTPLSAAPILMPAGRVLVLPSAEEAEGPELAAASPSEALASASAVLGAQGADARSSGEAGSGPDLSNGQALPVKTPYDDAHVVDRGAIAPDPIAVRQPPVASAVERMGPLQTVKAAEGSGLTPPDREATLAQGVSTLAYEGPSATLASDQHAAQQSDVAQVRFLTGEQAANSAEVEQNSPIGGRNDIPIRTSQPTPEANNLRGPVQPSRPDALLAADSSQLNDLVGPVGTFNAAREAVSEIASQNAFPAALRRYLHPEAGGTTAPPASDVTAFGKLIAGQNVEPNAASEHRFKQASAAIGPKVATAVIHTDQSPVETMTSVATSNPDTDASASGPSASIEVASMSAKIIGNAAPGETSPPAALVTAQIDAEHHAAKTAAAEALGHTRHAVPIEPHRQIADAIVRTTNGKIEITLDPVELGRVTVVMATDSSQSLGIIADRPETLDLIRRHSDQLLRDLRDNGMPDARLDFLRQDGRSSDGQGFQQGGGQRRGASDHRPQAQPADQPAVQPTVSSATRIDIRL